MILKNIIWQNITFIFCLCIKHMHESKQVACVSVYMYVSLCNTLRFLYSMCIAHMLYMCVGTYIYWFWIGTVFSEFTITQLLSPFLDIIQLYMYYLNICEVTSSTYLHARIFSNTHMYVCLMHRQKNYGEVYFSRTNTHVCVFKAYIRKKLRLDPAK